MSDPVEQGEQVDVEAADRAAGKWLTHGALSNDAFPELRNLARSHIALRERVRLLEQREKGIRGYLDQIDEHDSWPTTPAIRALLDDDYFAADQAGEPRE